MKAGYYLRYLELRESKMIRKLLKKDIPEIVRIHKNCIEQCNAKCYSTSQIQEWESDVSEHNILIQLESSSWIVLEIKNKIVGFAQYSLKNEELYQLQIDPNEQGKGYGKMLCEEIFKDFKTNNIKEISLYSTLNAVPFYLSLGFEEVKEIYYPLKKEKMEMIEMKRKI